MQLGILPWWLNKSILSETDCKNSAGVSAHICYLIRGIDRSAANKGDGLVGRVDRSTSSTMPITVTARRSLDL